MLTNTVPLLFAGFVIACLVSGIWLLIHLTALTAMFRGKADIVASPRRPRASRAAVTTAVAIFGGSLIGIFAMQVIAINA